jgi:hypothetical protein
MEDLIFNSTNLDTGTYDPKNKRLRVTFHSGKTYMYTKVPQVVIDQLMDSSSQGKYFRDNIQNNYNAIAV